MIISQLHEWHVTPAKAISIQKELASKICVKETLSNIYFIAGVDVAIYGRSEGTASIVVLNYPELQLVDHSSVRGTVDFPYVPGLLSFREIPLLIKAFECLKINPDLILVDGQGFAHPRRFGLASHLGLLLDLPTIGCAKSRLCGTHQEPGIIAGSTSDLVDTDEIIGSVVRTKSGTRPVYVSIGYKVSLEQAVEWTLKCCRGFRLPEPTRLAHQAAGGFLHQAVCSN